MKSLPLSIFAGLGVAIALIALAVQYQRLRSATGRFEGARIALGQLERDAGRIVHLRARRPTVAWKERPTKDVLALVNAALLEAGIPTSRLQGIGEGADAPVTAAAENAPTLRRQSLTLSLESLTPPQIGLLLQQWRLAQDQWVIDRLELTHRREAAPDLYDLRLYVSAVYLAGT